jgi:hypothetical protein
MWPYGCCSTVCLRVSWQGESLLAGQTHPCVSKNASNLVYRVLCTSGKDLRTAQVLPSFILPGLLLILRTQDLSEIVRSPNRVSQFAGCIVSVKSQLSSRSYLAVSVIDGTVPVICTRH